jgi:hypothetical protein
MYDELCEYFGVGLIAIIIGMLAINLLLDKDKRRQYNTYRTYITIFILAIIVHFIVQQLNLDTIYCGKKCQARIKANL